MDQESLEEEDELNIRIRHFLTKDNNFREAQFDPAPYLIKVLKEKEANQELLVEKQAELVELENQAQELIFEAASEKSAEFLSLLDLPQAFGMQLERLKHGTAKVKKKVKETKGLLLATQKDIQQIHLNCMLNKLVYKRLKEVELKLQQYETAALALKNHLYLDCALNLPIFAANSVLQTALAARTQNLKLRFLSQAIEEVRLFLYFTPRVSVPVQHSFLEKSEAQKDAFDEAAHAVFYKRYLLFKKAKCEEYLSSIWGLSGLDQRTGRVATIEGIIKGVMRIGKVNQITDSLSLDCRKSVANIFTVLLYFLAKENPTKKAVSKKHWITSPDYENHVVFLSTLFCVAAALIRKTTIVRRICLEYQLKEVCDRLSSQRILQMVRDEILNFVTEVYFWEEESQGIEDDPISKLRSPSNYILWPFFKHKIQACFTILTQQLTTVQKSLFSADFPDSYFFLKPFSALQKRYKDKFHGQLLKEIESIFPDGRGLVPENYDSILSTRDHKPSEIQFCQKYVSEDRKGLREFINLISLLSSLQKYYNANVFDPERLKVYCTFILLFFYLKINSAIFRSLISPSAYDKVIETRSKDAKVKNKEKNIQITFSPLAVPRDQHWIDKKFRTIQGDSIPFRNAEQLKMVKSQLEMLLHYCMKDLAPSPNTLNSPSSDTIEQELHKHQPSNYEQNIGTKLVRVWEQLVVSRSQGQEVQFLLAAVYRRFLDLYLSLNASVYLETGSF